MSAIHIRKHLDSDTLHLPELKPLIGKTVEITIVEEAPTPGVIPGTGDWDAAAKAVREIRDYDYDAMRDQNECDLQHAKDHLP